MPKRKLDASPSVPTPVTPKRSRVEGGILKLEGTPSSGHNRTVSFPPPEDLADQLNMFSKMEEDSGASSCGGSCRSLVGRCSCRCSDIIRRRGAFECGRGVAIATSSIGAVAIVTMTVVVVIVVEVVVVVFELILSGTVLFNALLRRRMLLLLMMMLLLLLALG